MVTAYYYYGGKLVALRKGTTLEYVHQDHLTGTALSTDSAGAEKSRVKYFPFGGTRSSSGTLGTDMKFTGQRLDQSGLYFYNARYYDAAIGRFISADTIVQAPNNPQSLNRYSYVVNNPLKLIDPTGHFGQCIGPNAPPTCATLGPPSPNPSPADFIGSGTPMVMGGVAAGAGAAALGSTGAGVAIIIGAGVCYYYCDDLFSAAGEAYGWLSGILAAKVSPANPENSIKDPTTKARVAELLEGSTPGKDSSSRQYARPGGGAAANDAFDKLAEGQNVTTVGNGVRTTKLPDGTEAKVRRSSEGSPTVEVRPPKGQGKPIEVRFNE